MNPTMKQIIQEHTRPLEPKPTNVTPVLHPMPGIRAVLFDVYGTLLISASGDIDAAKEAASAHAFEEAVACAGLDLSCPGDAGVRRLYAIVSRMHDEGREAGIDYPEVDMREVWGELVETMGGTSDQAQRDRLSLEYELRVNPVYPMPGAGETLRILRDRELPLGIISNAQAYTLALCDYHLPPPAGDVYFEPDLQVYSYQHRMAKPGEGLYAIACAALAKRGIAPAETLYVGNDMLKDIVPAAAAGFRTALFAGDARSLRRREEDARVAETRPDLVVTALAQLTDCLRP